MTDASAAITSVVIAAVSIVVMGLIYLRDKRAYKRARQAVPPGSAQGTSAVLSLLMQIDPPPDPFGSEWLDGVAEGTYLAQRYLMGRAQGLAIKGDFTLAVECARNAVALNDQRRFEGADHG